MMKYRDAPELEDRRAMLYHIANNLILEHLRAEARHHAAQHIPLDEAEPLYSNEPPVDAIADAQQMVERLITATLAELPPRCRLAFVLSRFDGLTYVQVAARMRISVKMVEKHITHALAACRLAVGDRDF
jgi:RNA polymerase sigma-70 factor (ECF subfamily)